MKTLTIATCMLCVLMLAAAAKADSPMPSMGNIWSVSQDGKLLNRVGGWEIVGDQCRLWFIGSPRLIDINMVVPASRASGTQALRYLDVDTHGRPDNPQAWTRRASGEVLLDFSTRRWGYISARMRRTQRIETFAGQPKYKWDPTPWTPLRLLP